MSLHRNDGRKTKPCNAWAAWTRGGFLLLLVLLSAVTIYHTKGVLTPFDNAMNDGGDNLRLVGHNQEYYPGIAEQYIVSNLDRLGFNELDNSDTCHIWSDPNATTLEVFNSLVAYKKDIDKYNEIITKCNPVPSVMDKIWQEGVGVDEKSRLYRDGKQGIFPSKQL